MPMIFEQLRPGIKQTVSQMLGEGAALSYPLAEQLGGQLCDSFFVYHSGVQTLRTRPFAKISFLAEDGTLVLYQDARVLDFMPAEQYPFSRKIHYELQGTPSVQEYQTRQAMLYKIYEQIRRFAYQPELTKQNQEQLGVYCMQLAFSEPRELIPFYRSLAPGFYQWALPMI